ncbi:AI-2E family transporter [Zobellia sp. 1_MG-2023]|uniref:AI-2E family transporter n=1 Tax=Zobellia sp. 1_MG-2023 TaxID=3062626 RepID=UPI0026E33FFA|nr:AI-2E family transporter [Zobellia sp. 1_MG-2023]MDO6817550.1 AI-2E family transporter [Zobellia sp. 1_MG-2023]
MKTIDPKIIRQLFVLLLIVLIGGLIFKEMAPYFSGVLGAITLYVLLKKPMAKLVNKGWKPDLAAGLLMFASVIIILIPVSGAVLMLGNKVSQAVNNSEKVTKAVKEQLQNVEQYVGYDLSSEIDVSAVSGWLSDNLQGFAGSTFTSVIAIGIMYFFLYFMLTNRKELRESLYEYIPISTNNLETIGSKIRRMVRANALGIPLVAIAQGVVALIGFLIFGIQNPFFWAVIVAIGSMIPFVGNMLGTLPVFILTLSTGDTVQAWGILIYGIVIVGSTDNIIRLYILRKLDDVHPLITLVGVLIGIPLFGFIGLIFGPLFVSLFLIIVQIYKQEYGKQDGETM